MLMIYEINHIWTAEMKWKWRNDRRSERSLCNCVKKPEKNSEVLNLIRYFVCSAATGARTLERLPLLMCIFVWINLDSYVVVAAWWVSCLVPVNELSYFLFGNEWSAVILLLAGMEIRRPVINMDLTSRKSDIPFNICHRTTLDLPL